ncbi:MAG: hypothetical protein V4437_01250 [Patescibacteria group bacterium]
MPQSSQERRQVHPRVISQRLRERRAFLLIGGLISGGAALGALVGSVLAFATGHAESAQSAAVVGAAVGSGATSITLGFLGGAR